MDERLVGSRVVVTGAGGQLGGYLRPALERVGATVVGLDARAGTGIDAVVDITDAASTLAAIRGAQPDAVIHGAAYTDVDGCERDPGTAHAVNVEGSWHVARAAKGVGAHLVAVGTDFVFPGDGGAPYAEDAAPRPLSVYGSSKLGGEWAVLQTDAEFAVARTAWLYGGAGKHFPRTVLSVLQDRGAMTVVNDEAGCPTFAGDLADALVALMAARGAGLFHLVNGGRATRHELAQAVAEAAGLDPTAVVPTTTAEFLAKVPLPAKRPGDSTLTNIRAAALGIQLRPWREALDEYVPRLAAEMGLGSEKVAT